MTLGRLSIAAFALSLTVFAAAALAQRGDDSSRKSKNGSASGTIDGVSIAIEYGRPKVRGRDIWGALVPFGKVWRTGADEATTIRFDQDVHVEGQALAAGTYALFTLPGKDRWTIIFNKRAQQWGAYGQDTGEDALRVTVTPQASGHTEALTFSVEADRVVLRWAELAVGFGVASAG